MGTAAGQRVPFGGADVEIPRHVLEANTASSKASKKKHQKMMNIMAILTPVMT
jgi:hypothetical protein